MTYCLKEIRDTLVILPVIQHQHAILQTKGRKPAVNHL